MWQGLSEAWTSGLQIVASLERFIRSGDLCNFAPHTHRHISNRLLAASMTGSVPDSCGLPCSELGLTAKCSAHLLRKRKQHSAAPRKAEPGHLDLETSRPFTDHTTLFLCLLFTLPSLPTRGLPLRKSPQGRRSLVLLDLLCPSETMTLSNRHRVVPVAMFLPFGIP